MRAIVTQNMHALQQTQACAEFAFSSSHNARLCALPALPPVGRVLAKGFGAIRCRSRSRRQIVAYNISHSSRVLGSARAHVPTDATHTTATEYADLLSRTIVLGALPLSLSTEFSVRAARGALIYGHRHKYTHAYLSERSLLGVLIKHRAPPRSSPHTHQLCIL